MGFHQCFGLAILFLINTINFLDRYSIAAVLDEIKAYYRFDATQSGLLSTCFLLGYMLTAPLFGYLGDKYSRKWILVGGILFWCVAAFTGSIIPREHKYLFFISRVLVGVGEACYSTIAPSIIADLFGPDSRKLALSIFYFAIPIGSGLGFLMGTLALELEDWRYIFWITPVIGLVSAGMLLFLDEPIRGQAERGARPHAPVKDEATVMENLRYLWDIKSYVYATTGFACCLFAMGALSWWAVSFVGVSRAQQDASHVTTIFGGIVCLAGFCGVTLGSSAAQYFRKYDGRADPFVCAVGIFIAVPFTFFGLILIRSYIGFAWVLLFLSVTSLSTNWAVVSDMLLSVTLPTKRSFASAMQILLSHLFGDAISPSITGFIRDELRTAMGEEQDKDYEPFLYSLLLTLPILTFGAVAFLFSAKYFVKDVENCKLGLALQKESSDESVRVEGANLTDFAASP